MSLSKRDGSRDGFTSNRGFILACIGSAVGMGNIWRFPTLVSSWGGLTFLIPYFIFVVLIGSTGVIGEMALGRTAGGGPVKAFGRCVEEAGGRCKIGSGIGMIPVLGSLALAIGYTCVMGWIFRYSFMSLNGSMWAMGQDMDVIGGTFGKASSAGGSTLWIIIAVIISCLIMIFGISRGIEKANKVMMPVLFLLFAVLAVYILTLNGAAAGYRYIFTIDPEGLKNPMLWIYAFGQAFFSLSIAGNGTIIYGSYLSKKENIPRSAAIVAIFDTIAALLASAVIIPAMAVGGAELSKGGPGLMFIYLIRVMNGMPGGRIVEIIFYVCVAFAGITSIINLYEVSVAYLQDTFGIGRGFSSVFVHVSGGTCAIFIQGIVSGWMDVVSIYICPLGALLAGIMFYWIAGRDFVLKAVNEGKSKPVGKWFFPLAKYVFCPAALAVLIAGAILGGIG